MTAPPRLVLPRAFGLGALLLAGLVAGCEEDVTMTETTDRPFTLFGILSPQLDTQWVRVFPVEALLSPATPAPLAATFTSTDEHTGETHRWQDSLLVEPDGQYAHVFWAPFRAEYEHRYRLDLVHADGRRSTVATTVPPPAEIFHQRENVDDGFVFLPILVRGEAPSLLRIEVTYEVDFVLQEVGIEPPDTVIVSYSGRQQPTAGGWVVEIDLVRDYARVLLRLERKAKQLLNRTYGLRLKGMEIRLIVASADWRPVGGLLNPELLVDPGTMTNVENGFGFVGAGYRLRHAWLPTRSAVESSGFHWYVAAPAE
jgi:hypothetical protein